MSITTSWTYLRSLATRLDTAGMFDDAEKVRILAQALEDADKSERRMMRIAIEGICR